MEVNGPTSTELCEFNQHLTLFQTTPMSGYPACFNPWAELRNHPKLTPRKSHTALGRSVCEAQSCSQQLTQVHLAQGVAFRCLPLNSFVLTLFPSQSYLTQSRGEAFQVEQAGAIPSQTRGCCRSQTSGRDKMKHFGNKPTPLIITLFIISHKFCSFSSFHCLHTQ